MNTKEYIKRIGDSALWDAIEKHMAEQKAPSIWRCDHDVSLFEHCDKCEGSREWSLALPIPAEEE